MKYEVDIMAFLVYEEPFSFFRKYFLIDVIKVSHEKKIG